MTNFDSGTKIQECFMFKSTKNLIFFGFDNDFDNDILIYNYLCDKCNYDLFFNFLVHDMQAFGSKRVSFLFKNQY